MYTSQQMVVAAMITVVTVVSIARNHYEEWLSCDERAKTIRASRLRLDQIMQQVAEIDEQIQTTSAELERMQQGNEVIKIEGVPGPATEVDDPPPLPRDIVDNEDVYTWATTKLDPTRYSTLPAKVELPSVDLPYDGEVGEVGVCKHWRAGNRSTIMLDELPAQVSPHKVFSYIHGMPAGYGAQSLYYCAAASRLKWKAAALGKFPGGLPASFFPHVKERNVALLCGRDVWSGWERQMEPLRRSKAALLQRRWEGAFDEMNKIEMFQSVKAASDAAGCNYVDQGFMSESYDFSSTQDCVEFFKRGQDDPESYHNNVWVTKTTQHKAGGVKMMDYDHLKQEYGACQNSHMFLVQRFMHDIQLLDERKWDARVYVLLASIDPLIVYSFDIFHIRASLTKFEDPLAFLRKSNSVIGKKDSGTEAEKLSGSLLTNAAVQLKTHPKKNYAEHMLHPDKVGEYLASNDIDKTEFMDTIFRRIQSVVEFVFHSVGEWPKVPGRFRVYGFDFMVDKSFKPVLIDVNRTPGFPGKNQFAKELVNTVFEEAVTLTHEIHAGKGLGVARPPQSNHFHLTYYRPRTAEENAQEEAADAA